MKTDMFHTVGKAYWHSEKKKKKNPKKKKTAPDHVNSDVGLKNNGVWEFIW